MGKVSTGVADTPVNLLKHAIPADDKRALHGSEYRWERLKEDAANQRKSTSTTLIENWEMPASAWVVATVARSGEWPIWCSAEYGQYRVHQTLP